MNMPKRASLNHFKRASLCPGVSAGGAADVGTVTTSNDPAANITVKDVLSAMPFLRQIAGKNFMLNYSVWKTSAREMHTGELSGFTSMISDM
jgi:hypothetical protein